MENKKSYILITGASSDIGIAIAKKLCKQYPLILHGRNDESLSLIIEELNSPNGVIKWVADLAQCNLLKPSLKELMAKDNIAISGFIHCAGALKILPIKNFREDYAKYIFDVNFFSAIEIIQVLLLKANISFLNRIVFISALYSKRGNKGNAIYAASKGALDSLVHSLALELGPSVKINSILPGAIRTKMTAHLYEDPIQKNKLDERYILGEGSSNDIALMAEFLLGEGGNWITGQNYLVDGGASCV